MAYKTVEHPVGCPSCSGREVAMPHDQDGSPCPSCGRVVRPATVPSDPIQEQIDRVKLTREAVQEADEPILARANVLAQLYQAQALERIADLLEDFATSFTDVLELIGKKLAE